MLSFGGSCCILPNAPQWFTTSTRRRYEIRLSLFPPLKAAVVVQLQTDCSTCPAHSGMSQVVPTPSDDPNSMVSASGAVHSDLQQVASGSGRLVHHQIQQQTPVVCISRPGWEWAIDALCMSWKGLYLYAFPLVALLGKVVSKLLESRPSSKDSQIRCQHELRLQLTFCDPGC